ncbi:MAG: hypothetical protein V1835_00275 [Candidatus Micrarchaeota archaeon]
MAMKHMRGQSGIELATYFGFLIIIFMIFSVEAAYRMGVAQRSRDSLEAERVGGTAATHINIAHSVGNGYSAVFYLPESLSNSYYNISVYTSILRLEIWYSSGFAKSFPLLTGNVTGVPVPGKNLIKNVDGEIIIE